MLQLILTGHLKGQDCGKSAPERGNFDVSGGLFVDLL